MLKLHTVRKYLTLLLMMCFYLLGQAIAQTISSYAALLNEARTELQSKSPQLALATSEKAITADPSRWEGYVFAAYALVELGRSQEAVSRLTDAIALAPKDKQEQIRQLKQQIAAGQAKEHSQPPVGQGSSQKLAQSLEAQINSIGQLNWTESLTSQGSPPQPVQVSEKLDNARVQLENCSIRITRRTTRKTIQGNDVQDEASTYLFESVDKIEALDADVAENRIFNPGAQYSSTPAMYAVEVNGLVFIRVPDKGLADQITYEIDRLSDVCKEVTPSVASVPSVEESLHPIAENLNREARANWLSVAHDPQTSRTAGPGQSSDAISSAMVDSRTCRLSYHQKQSSSMGWYNGDYDRVLSLRRIRKLQVMSMQDWYKASQDPGWNFAITPATWILVIHSEFNSWSRVANAARDETYLVFSDEGQANAIAQELQHAADLCGAGNYQEPF